MKKHGAKKITLTAVFAAMIAVMTAFVKIPTGINEGYLHFGDSMIYLSGCLLGSYAAAAAAIGGGLADLLAGAAVWSVPTALIKVCNTLPFIIATACYEKATGKRKIVHLTTGLMTVVSGLITVFGYLLAEGLLYSFASAWTSVPFSVVQALGSGIVFLSVGAALDAIDIRKYL